MKTIPMLLVVLSVLFVEVSCVDNGCPTGSEEAAGGKCVDAVPKDAGQDIRGIAGDSGSVGNTSVECRPLAPPVHGSVGLAGRTEGAVAKYGCEEGFGLIGAASRSCRRDGRWSGDEPSCAPGDCPSLTSPEHGTVTTPRGTAVGAAAQFSCEAGFTLSGDAERSCQADKTWSGEDPHCDPVDCGAPAPPDHGAADSSAGTLLGATATYSCSEGHELIGDASRQCGSNGQWSGPVPSCEVVDCGPLSAPTSGTVETMAGTTFGAIAEYGCTGTNGLVGSASRMCQADGTWSGAAPTCAPGACPNLMRPQNGTLATPTGTGVGAIATFDCLSGYRRVGAMTSTCQSDSTWSAAPPACEIMACPTLPDPANGTVTRPARLIYGETASYACKPGYYLSGAATRTCQENGSWFPAEPTCSDANIKGLRLQQLHIGSDEFVFIRNTDSQTATLVGVHIEARDNANTFGYDFTGGTLAGQAEARIGRGAASQYPFAFSLAGSRGGLVMVCAAKPCTADTVLDAMTYRGDGDPPTLPARISMNAPVLGIDSTRDNSEDFYRMPYTGAAPSFTSCDWSTGPQRLIFAESFECGDARWTTTGGAWELEGSDSPDGSDTVMRQTGAANDGTVGKEFVFASAIFPTHIEYWMRGGNTTQLCSALNPCTGAGAIGATLYWDYKNNLCWAGAGLSCLDQGNGWDFVELDEIDWTAGTLRVRINGVEAVSTAVPPTSPHFGSTFTPGAGLRKILLTRGGKVEDGGSTWDGFRMW